MVDWAISSYDSPSHSPSGFNKNLVEIVENYGFELLELLIFAGRLRPLYNFWAQCIRQFTFTCNETEPENGLLGTRDKYIL